MGKKDNFDQAFQEVAIEVNIPAEFRAPLCRAMKKHIDSPRDAAKVAEVWLSKFEFKWSDGETFLRDYENKKGTFKQLCALFARYVSGKHSLAEQWERTQESKKSTPYVMISWGTTIKPCPDHVGTKGLVLPVDHPYWNDRPLRQRVFCQCRIRGVTRFELEKLRAHGTQDPDAPHILSADGLPTGRQETRLIPIRETPPPA